VLRAKTPPERAAPIAHLARSGKIGKPHSSFASREAYDLMWNNDAQRSQIARSVPCGELDLAGTRRAEVPSQILSFLLLTAPRHQKPPAESARADRFPCFSLVVRAWVRACRSGARRFARCGEVGEGFCSGVAVPLVDGAAEPAEACADVVPWRHCCTKTCCVIPFVRFAGLVARHSARHACSVFRGSAFVCWVFVMCCATTGKNNPNIAATSNRND